MIGNNKTYGLHNYNWQYWSFMTKFRDAYKMVSPKQRIENIIRQTVICLENDDVYKALKHIEKANRVCPENPDIVQLAAVVQMTMAQKRNTTQGLS